MITCVCFFNYARMKYSLYTIFCSITYAYLEDIYNFQHIFIFCLILIAPAYSRTANVEIFYLQPQPTTIRLQLVSNRAASQLLLLYTISE